MLLKRGTGINVPFQMGCGLPDAANIPSSATPLLPTTPLPSAAASVASFAAAATAASISTMSATSSVGLEWSCRPSRTAHPYLLSTQLLTREHFQMPLVHILMQTLLFQTSTFTHLFEYRWRPYRPGQRRSARAWRPN